MSIIPNYLAMYNLSQIEADILIVTDLTATTGTIYTLNSTTGTITTLNTTTGNITTLNTTTANITTLITDLWRGTSSSSSMVIGVVGDTGTLTSYRSLIMEANKTITLNATGGVINCNSFQGTTASSAILLFTNTTGNSIYIGNTSNGNGIVPQQDVIMQTGKNILITPTGNLQVETIRGNTLSNPVSLYLAQTGAISFGNNLGTGGGITFNDNITLPANRTITLNATGGKILCNTFEGIAAANNIVLFSTTTGTTTLGNTAGGSFTINPSVVLPANKTITLNATGGKILCNTLTGTATSSTIEIGESGDTGLIRTRKDLYIGSTPFSSNKGIYCNYFDALAASDTINFSATQTTGNINIQPGASNGSIVIGNTIPASDSGTLTINKNTILPANKSITLNTTGGKILCNVYTGTATSSNLTLGESGNTGNLQIFKTITSSNTYSGNNTYSGVNTFSGATNTFSNEILCSIYTGLTTSANFQLGKSGDSGRVNCFRDLYIQTGKIVDSEVIQTNTLRAVADLVVGNALGSASNIFLVNSITANESLTIINSKNLLCNTYRGTTAASNISLFSTTTGSLTLGGVSSGIVMNDNVSLGTGDNLTLSTTGKIVVDTIEGTAPTDNIDLFNTSTTPNITIASGLTLGAMFLGNLTNNNPRIWMYNDLWLGTTATNRTIYSNVLRTLQNSNSGSLYDFTTTGSVFCGGSLTSGNINLHNPAFTTGRINLQAPAIVSTLEAVSATSGTTNIFTNTTTGSTINLGTGATTSLINIGTGLTTGRIRLYNDRIHIGAGAGATSTTGLCTQALYCVAIGTNAQTTGAGINSIAIGANAGQTNQAANSIVLNASGIAVNGATAGSFYVRPMNTTGGYTNFVSYNPSNYEVYYTPSSAKYKDNVINLDRDFDDVLKLQSREYRFNQRGNDLHIGYIAEEVYDINKEFSTTNEDGGEPANIAWFNIVLYQNEVIKRLDKELKELKLRVDNLEI